MERALQNFDKARGVARKKFEDQVKSTKAMLAEASPPEYIRANPWSAVGIAVAAGLVLGAVLARR